MIRDFINSPDLRIDSKWYSRYLKGLADLWFLSDLNGKRDITTDLVRHKGNTKAVITAKADGMIAGIDEVKWLCSNHPRFAGITTKFTSKDGSRVRKGQSIGLISGKYGTLMATERIILNIMQRMSGIATHAASLASKVKRYSVVVASTRKTYFGPLDKWACVLGGCASHRLGLWDAVLIKDNHLAAGVSLDFSKVRNAKFIDIEIEHLHQLGKVLGDLKAGKTKVIFMLDNFDIRKIPDAIRIIKGAGHHVELSGGITEKNLLKYAKLRPDFISMSELTQDASPLDISMEVTSTP